MKNKLGLVLGLIAGFIVLVVYTRPEKKTM